MFKLSGQYEFVILIRANGSQENIDTENSGFPIGLVDDVSKFIDQTEFKVYPGDIPVFRHNPVKFTCHLASNIPLHRLLI